MSLLLFDLNAKSEDTGNSLNDALHRVKEKAKCKKVMIAEWKSINNRKPAYALWHAFGLNSLTLSARVTAGSKFLTRMIACPH